VIGGGASGMAAAVFLKDNGYSVKVIEKKNKVGGHVNTLYFTPPAPGLANWLDIGVIGIANTSYLNEIGVGKWKVETDKFIQRFIGNNVIPIQLYFPTATGVNFATGVSYGPVSVDTTSSEYQAAYNTFISFIDKYPWLSTSDFPDPIPAELLIPFTEFIEKYQLELLFPSLFYEDTTGFGLGELSKLPTLLPLFFASKVLLSDKSLTAVGGWQSLYDQMELYLSRSNVYLNAEVTHIKRTPSRSRKPVEIVFRQHKQKKIIKCKDVIISFPPTLENLSFMELSRRERTLFREVSTRYYYCYSASAQGQIASSTFTLANVDPTQPYNTPVYPAAINVYNYYGYGPSAGLAFSQTPISTKKMKTIVSKQLSNIPSSLANVTLEDFFLS